MKNCAKTGICNSMKKFICILLVLLSINLFIISCENSEEEIDINTRIEIFLNTVMNDPKIPFFDGFDNFDTISEELQRFIFHIAIYKGSVYQNTGTIGDGLSKEMIEENIRAVFGAEVILKLDYDYICAAYDDERGIYIPWVYGAPQYNLRYVFHSIENVKDNVYKAVVSYIDTNGFLLSFDADGSGDWIIPDEINDRIKQRQAAVNVENPEYAKARKDGIEEFTQEILKNPEKYEKTEVYLEVGDDYIKLISAKKYDIGE